MHSSIVQRRVYAYVFLSRNLYAFKINMFSVTNKRVQNSAAWFRSCHLYHVNAKSFICPVNFIPATYSTWMRVKSIDCFWLLGWLNHDRAICTRIALLGILSSHRTALLWILRSFQGLYRKGKKNCRHDHLNSNWKLRVQMSLLTDLVCRVD